VNGEICGFEIKSDADRLVRLFQQEPAFSAVFDRVSVVTTIRHLTRAREVIPAWWGIVIASIAESGVAFSVKRSAKENKRTNTENLLYVLTRKELNEIAKRGRLAVAVSKMRQPELVGALIQSLPSKDIRDFARDILKRRSTVSYHSSPSSPPFAASGA
jgi:hypothetical protein